MCFCRVRSREEGCSDLGEGRSRAVPERHWRSQWKNFRLDLGHFLIDEKKNGVFLYGIIGVIGFSEPTRCVEVCAAGGKERGNQA